MSVFDLVSSLQKKYELCTRITRDKLFHKANFFAFLDYSYKSG